MSPHDVTPAPYVAGGLPARRRSPSSPHLSARLDQLVRLFGVQVAPDDPRRARLHAALADVDPLADALVAAMHAQPATRADFERALVRGIASVADPAPALGAFFAHVDERPAWFDPAYAAVGGRAMSRHGVDALLALSAVLMAGYLTENATRVLVMTGSLTKNVHKRLHATGQYVCDVVFSPGLERFSPGFISSLRVRVVHAEVRRALTLSPRWDGAHWGPPVNQRDMLVTQLEFSVSYQLAVAMLGRIDRADEREAIMHLWRYAGTLMGVRPELLPTSFRAGLELLAIFNETEAGPSDDGRALSAALVAAWLRGPEGARNARLQRTLGRSIAGYCRHFVGGAAADRLGLPDDLYQHWPIARALVRLPLELAQQLAPGLRHGAEERGAALIARLYGYPRVPGAAAEARPLYAPSAMRFAH
jgi:hypothetical protein